MREIENELLEEGKWMYFACFSSIAVCVNAIKHGLSWRNPAQTHGKDKSKILCSTFIISKLEVNVYYFYMYKVEKQCLGLHLANRNGECFSL